MSNTDNQEGNPVELFKSLLDTMKTISSNAIQAEKENNENVPDNSSSDSSEDEGDSECEGDCDSDYEDEYDEEQTKLKLFNNLLESHRLLCEAFSKLYKH
jgi:hypothetical protein